MIIEDFENQIEIGAKVKIDYGHGNTKEYGTKTSLRTYVFMGYKPCHSCMVWRDCLGSIELRDVKTLDLEGGCYRNRKKNNIRLRIVNPRYLPDNLFDI